MKTFSTNQKPDSQLIHYTELTDKEVKDIFYSLAAGVVGKKEQMVVQVEEMRNSSLFIIKCAVEDRGKIIGSGGETIRAFQSIATTIGSIRQRGVAVSMFDEPSKRPNISFSKREVSEKWSAADFAALIQSITSQVLSINNIEVDFKNIGDSACHFEIDLHGRGSNQHFESNDPVRKPAVMPSLMRLFTVMAANNGIMITFSTNQ